MSGQLVAYNLSANTSAQEHALGERVNTEIGDRYIYLKAAGTADVANTLYHYDPDTFTIVAALTSTIAAAGECHPLVVAETAHTASYFGWYFCGPGSTSMIGHGAVAAQSNVRTSATAGAIDDASAGTLLPGVKLYDAIASATDTGVVHASHEMYVSEDA